VPEISGMFVFVYEDLTRLGAGPGGDPTGAFGHHKAFTIGARPQYHVNDYFKIALDGGFQQLTPKAGDTSARNLFKITLAPSLSPAPAKDGAFFTRPELRIFGTYASWNGAAQQAGILGQGGCPGTTSDVFQCDDHGLTFGAQLETWW
jgi:maltoporin